MPSSSESVFLRRCKLGRVPEALQTRACNIVGESCMDRSRAMAGFTKDFFLKTVELKTVECIYVGIYT